MEYVILLTSLVGIVFGADFLVTGSVSLARKYGVSDFVVGAVIVGMGTSMPEFVVSFIGALNGNSDVAIGNVVGSNIFNILGILGLTAVFFPVATDRKNVKFELPLCVGVSILLTLLAFDLFFSSTAGISRIDGVLLLLIFTAFMYFSFVRDRKNTATVTRDPVTVPLWKSIAKVAGGLVLLITSCDLFVDNAVIIAKSFGVSEAFISLTLIACGTSLPELAASIAAAVKKNTDMALGNIIGSNIFNITFILGLSSMVVPLTSSGITLVDYAVMIAASVLTFLLGLKGRIGRAWGIVMIVCFVVYNCYLVTNQID
jgi:cation:H+ antiporter